ncbi:THAP domain-containing protein 7-like [Plakobranchus ocellatus]|uniref:THAP domain-containing protein 7-like n=1 Tax=Plakobranchus ocellatus TaxID=259542 RepID=A0AAV3Y8Q7_9GAST|nr:THAP domain-containing protein 7-like [Plakobranchus ocellatus]
MVRPRQKSYIRRGGEFCGAANCKNARNKKDCRSRFISFHHFPKDEARCQLWLQLSRRHDLIGLSVDDIQKKHLVLCSDHFAKNQFNAPKELCSQRRRLVWNAVPTIFDVPNTPPKSNTTLKIKHTAKPISEVLALSQTRDPCSSDSEEDIKPDTKLLCPPPENG